MDHCAYHPNHEGIEHCEICNQALCGFCLWYGDDGRRLCEIHAREVLAEGKLVLPPDTYDEAINNSLVTIPPGESTSQTGDPIRYKGNREDLNALLALVIAASSLFSCFGGVYCLPLVSAVLGLAALSSASRAVDPGRTRRLAGTGLFSSGLMFACMLIYILSILGVLVFGIISSSAGP